MTPAEMVLKKDNEILRETIATRAPKVNRIGRFCWQWQPSELSVRHTAW